MMRVIFVLLLFLSTAKADGLEDFLFKTEGLQTDAFLVSKDGKVVYEKLSRGYNREMKHLSWSVAKTISGILIGKAIDLGYMKLDDPIKKYLPNFRGDGTILDALQMSSGMKFVEFYSGVPTDADVVKMLYLDGTKESYTDFFSSLPKNDYRPGQYFYYSSGDTNLLMQVLKKALPESESYADFPWKYFFDPMGIKATMEMSSRGTYIGSSYLYMPATGYLKIGELLINEGRFQGKEIIPAWYLKKMNQVAPGVLKNPLDGTSETRAYSFHITTNKPITDRGLPSEYKSLPEDTLLLLGHQGQIVAASPSEKLVIVRLATDKVLVDRDKLFSLVKERFQISNIKKSKVIASNIKVPKKKPSAFDWSLSNISHVMEKMSVIPSLLKQISAKELCSCHFVIGRSLDQCFGDLKALVPTMGWLPFVKVDYSKLTVKTSLIFGKESSAQYRGPKSGCTL